jgi:hypothetical protein
MDAKAAIQGTINMAHFVTQQYLKDLSDADLFIRPAPGTNHIAWQLGHLIASERQMVTALGHSMPALPDGFAESYTKETSTSDDRAKFHTKAEYLSLLGRMHEGSIKALNAIPDSDLDKPGPEDMRAYAPTVGAVFNLVGQHELMHVGQFVPVRRKLGKPVVI